MKSISALVLAIFSCVSLQAQIEFLPPDFVLFGKTSGEYAAAYIQYTVPLSTNRDALLPNAVPFGDAPVYFLERPLFGIPVPPEPQTYFIPDDVYIYFPLNFFWGDNVDSCPPCYTVEELRSFLKILIDRIVAVHASVNGVALTNLLAYRIESPVFSFFLPSSDNFYSIVVKHPLDGLIDPAVTSGYFVMFKPLPAGFYDFRTGASNGPPNNFAIERHFQVYSLTPPQFAVRQTETLRGLIIDSALATQRQQPLLASLNAAKASFTSSNSGAGINQLRAFQNKLRAQIADESLADQLSEEAQRIIDRATAHTQ